MSSVQGLVETHVISSTTRPTLNFTDIENVACSWIVDFSFLTMCRYFREKNSEKFSKTLRAFEATVDDIITLPDDQQTKRTICCFLSRIMDAKNLDIHYDMDNKVTPLMSAVCVWECLKDTTSDAALHESIANLLFIQCVGVCLEKGNAQLAAHTLQWLEKEGGIQEKLLRKLSTIVSKKDVYDKLLTSFSFDRLLENINSFLDSFLAEHPSDFLMKSASRVVQARQERSEHDPDQICKEPQEPSPAKNKTKAVSSELRLRPKKKLLLTKNVQPWKPETAKKIGRVHRSPKFSVSKSIFSYPSSPQDNAGTKPRRKNWKWEEDMNLKAGVRKYGEGKWAQILEKFDFEGRTGVMLKDRWRTLKKKGLVQ